MEFITVGGNHQRQRMPGPPGEYDQAHKKPENDAEGWRLDEKTTGTPVPGASAALDIVFRRLLRSAPDPLFS